MKGQSSRAIVTGIRNELAQFARSRQGADLAILSELPVVDREHARKVNDACKLSESDSVLRGTLKSSGTGDGSGFKTIMIMCAALARFGSAARGDPIYDAGVQLGKLLRTAFLADYLVNGGFRRELRRVLNRGEAVNALKRAIYTGRVAPAQARRADEMQAVADEMKALMAKRRSSIYLLGVRSSEGSR